MTLRFLFSLVLVISMCPILANVAIAASAMGSQWTSPNTVTKEEVFNAALSAGVENNYTLVSNDRTAGIISFKQERRAGSNYESRLNIRIYQEDDKIVVGTKTSGVGGLLGLVSSGKIFRERIHNFHVDLFRELKITDPSQKKILLKEE